MIKIDIIIKMFLKIAVLKIIIKLLNTQTKIKSSFFDSLVCVLKFTNSNNL